MNTPRLKPCLILRWHNHLQLELLLTPTGALELNSSKQCYIVQKKSWKSKSKSLRTCSRPTQSSGSMSQTTGARTTCPPRRLPLSGLQYRCPSDPRKRHQTEILFTFRSDSQTRHLSPPPLHHVVETVMVATPSEQKLKSLLLYLSPFLCRDWFRSFFSNCTALGGCRVDFLNTHVYSCDVDYIITFLQVDKRSSFLLCSGAFWWVWSEDLADRSCLSFCKRGRGDPDFHGRAAAATGGSRSRGSVCLVCQSLPNTGWRPIQNRVNMPFQDWGQYWYLSSENSLLKPNLSERTPLGDLYMTSACPSTAWEYPDGIYKLFKDLLLKTKLVLQLNNSLWFILELFALH